MSEYSAFGVDIDGIWSLVSPARTRPSDAPLTLLPRSFSIRLVLVFATLTITVGLLSAWVVYQQARAQQFERIRTQLQGIAATAAVAIDGDAFDGLRAPGQQDSDAYRDIQLRLDRIRHANEDIRFVYTMRRDDAGQVSFVVDAPAVDFDGDGAIGEDEEMALLAEPYPDAASMPALLTGFEHASADGALTHDRWGWMLSGYAPIQNARGEPVGLVGVDMMAGRLDELRRAFLIGCASIALAVALASLLLASSLSWRLVRPVRTMQRQLSAVHRGEREHLDPVPGNRELDDLSRGFNELLNARRQVEAKLQESAKLEVLAQLSAAMAHDFNNHLTVIATTTELMAMGAQRSPEDLTRLERIQRAAGGAAAEVRRLLLFARQRPEPHGPVDLHEAILAVADLLQGSAKGIELELDLADDPAVVTGDLSELQSALMNLALNARDAMPSGGTLRFATRLDPAGGTVHLAVQDSGTGMGDDVRARVFDPFFTTKPAGRGTGLGMLAVKTMVERHDARISIDTAPGQGTTVALVFPQRDHRI